MAASPTNDDELRAEVEREFEDELDLFMYEWENSLREKLESEGDDDADAS